MYSASEIAPGIHDRESFAGFVDADGNHPQLFVGSLFLVGEDLPQVFHGDISLGAFVCEGPVFVALQQECIHIGVRKSDQLLPALLPVEGVEGRKGADEPEDLFRSDLTDSGFEVGELRFHIVDPVGGDIALIDRLCAAALLDPVLALRPAKVERLAVQLAEQLHRRIEVVDFVAVLIQRLFPEIVAAGGIAARVLCSTAPN